MKEFLLSLHILFSMYMYLIFNGFNICCQHGNQKFRFRVNEPSKIVASLTRELCQSGQEQVQVVLGGERSAVCCAGEGFICTRQGTQAAFWCFKQFCGHQDNPIVAEST